jgi:hypothetical protein
MKATIEDLRDSFKIGYEAFEASRKESNEVWDLYHNRHYTDEQRAVLENRGQPIETFNVIKMFARMLVGYYSTIVNTVVVSPRNPRDVDTASILNDTVNNVFADNRFDIEGDEIKLGGMVSGLLCAYVNVVGTGEEDDFGRPIHRIVTHSVPDSELVLDPASKLDDYSDARYLHRFKWLSGDAVKKRWSQKVVDKLDSYYNHLNIDEADFEFNYGDPYTGYYKVHDNYLIVHTVMTDDAGKSWSVFWSGDEVLEKHEITTKDARWPYRVQKLHSSNRTEFYGIFREVIGSQRALNQAVLKIQLMVNSEKAFVEEGAVENIDEFTDSFNRVNAVVEVLNLNGVRIEKLSREILEQYTIIDKALDRIQRVLGINDSFLGMAYASDSGRKVKLQQNATIMSLRYVTARIESFYRSLGYDIAYLAQQYYHANQFIMVADEVVGQRWIELNKPMMEFTGQFDPQGQPVMQPILLPETDPANGDFITDEAGNIILAPVSEDGTDFSFMPFQITVESTSYNDEDEKAQLLLETVMSGNIGQMTAQVNPAGFFKMASLSMKSTKTKYSPNIAAVLDQTAQMLAQNPEMAMSMQDGQQQPANPKSKALKLPQNTNEGVM